MKCLQGPPLPELHWGDYPPVLILTPEEHQKLVERAEDVLRVLLRDENYDSVHSLLYFYEAYKREGGCLYDFFKRYKPILRNKEFTCVGLALELIKKWHQLDNDFPDFANFACLVSCEQDVAEIEKYVVANRPDTVARMDKEHALVCVTIEIDERPGVLLADPGYHVARVITVMMDRSSPNTGWITLLDLPKCKKEFCYKFNYTNHNYIEWHEKKTRDYTTITESSLIYVARPYLDSINVTIRRNLVYDSRSIMARNENGHLLGGVYFKICPIKNEFTLIMHVKEKNLKTKHSFTLFYEGEVIPEPLLIQLTEVNTLLNFEDGELITILRKVAKILKDQGFVTHMLKINEYIQDYIREIRDADCQE